MKYLYRYDLFGGVLPGRLVVRLVLRRYPVQRETENNGVWVLVWNYDEIDPVTEEPVVTPEEMQRLGVCYGYASVVDEESFKKYPRRTKKLVFRHFKKQWACETVEEALASFVWRKKKQRERAQQWVETATRGLRLAAELDDRYSAEAKEKAQSVLQRSGTFLDD